MNRRIEDDENGLPAASTGLDTREKADRPASGTLGGLAGNLEFVRTVLDSLPDHVYVKDRDGRYLLVNEVGLRERGLAGLHQIVGTTVYESMPPALAERMASEDRTVMESGEPLVNREAATRFAGNDQPRWHITTKIPMHDARGDVVGIVGINRDITDRKRIELALRESEETFRATFEQAAVGIGIMSLETQFERVNAKYCEILGYSSDELLRMRLRDINPAGAHEDAVDYRRRLVSGEVRGGLLREKQLLRKDGSLVWVALATSLVRGEGGVPRCFVTVMEDISARKRASAALHESEERFRQLAAHIPQVFWIADAALHETLYVSPASAALYGRAPEALTGAAALLVEMAHPQDRPAIESARAAAPRAGHYDETYRVVRPDGSVIWVRDRAFPVHDESGEPYRMAGIVEDITERKRSEMRLEHLAHYDVLTGLPNRVLFYDRLRQTLAQAARSRWVLGVMFIDVDRFKKVNDTFGHAAGDKLLQQVAERLARAVRAGDVVGRLGGDEFAVVLADLAAAKDAGTVAQKILAGFQTPFPLEGKEVYVGASIGVALYPHDSSDQDTLIKNADAAMYHAKKVGRNCFRFYKPEMNARAADILALEGELRRAFERNEFTLRFQPKVSLASGEITGAEALLRWRHPQRGIVGPAEFMAVMEETGLVVRAGSWVLEAVCEEIGRWLARGVPPVPVAINLSARQFRSPDLLGEIRQALRRHGVDPCLLEVEITESSLMRNTDQASDTLRQLKSLGIKRAIDDFGTGYSSLSYLRRFPIDTVKIDRSFVREIPHNNDDAAITRAVISMAHSLGLGVVAEGVETVEQLAFLTAHGCDQMQGYLFAKPMEGEEFATWLDERRRLPA